MSGPSLSTPGGPPSWALVSPRSGPYPPVLTDCPWVSSGLQAAVFWVLGRGLFWPLSIRAEDVLFKNDFDVIGMILLSIDVVLVPFGLAWEDVGTR